MPARSAHAPLMRALVFTRDEAETKRLAQLSLVLSFVHRAYGVSPVYVLGPSRGSQNLSQARQIFQYLSHVGFGHSYSDIAAFANRDRTSVAHGCHQVEDRRDDKKIDRALHFAEMAIVQSFDISWDDAHDPGR